MRVFYVSLARLFRGPRPAASVSSALAGLLILITVSECGWK